MARTVKLRGPAVGQTLDMTASHPGFAQGSFDAELQPVETPPPPPENPTIDPVAEPADGATLSVPNGRVLETEVFSGNVTGITVTQHPEPGHIVVRHDNSLAFVMTESFGTLGDFPAAFTVHYSDAPDAARSVTITTTDVGPAIVMGFPAGELYVPRKDANGDFIFAPGPDYFPVYVTPSGHTAASIESAETLSPGTVDNDWLMAQDPYKYGSEAFPLATSLGEGLFFAADIAGKQAAIFYERGNTYDTLEKFDVERVMHPLHPTIVGSWGTGEIPDMSVGSRYAPGARREGLVVRDIKTFGMAIRRPDSAGDFHDNIMLSGVTTVGDEVAVTNVNAITLHRCKLLDSHINEGSWPSDARDEWSVGSNRKAAFHCVGTSHLLFEETHLDHGGYDYGFYYDARIDGPQPPTSQNHNGYFQKDTIDANIRRCVSSRASLSAFQFRSGGYISDLLVFDCPFGFQFGGLAEKGTTNPHYSIGDGIIFTLGSHRNTQVTPSMAVGNGVQFGSPLAVLTRTLFLHVMDPDNPDEPLDQLEHPPEDTRTSLSQERTNVLSLKGEYLDGTLLVDIVRYRWAPWIDANYNTGHEGKEAALDAISLNKYADIKRSTTGSDRHDFAVYLRDDLDHVGEIIDDVFEYFMTPAGYWTAPRSTPTTVYWRPRAQGDGRRADHRFNWSTWDLPRAGDTVRQLGGHIRWNCNFDDGPPAEWKLDGGVLDSCAGYFDPATLTGIGSMKIRRFGQVELVAGYSGAGLTIDAQGGLVRNVGTVSNTDLTIGGLAEVALGENGGTWTVSSDRSLVMIGSQSRVGFDADDGSTCSLVFEAGATWRVTPDANGVSTIGTMRSGWRSTPESTNGTWALNLGGCDMVVNLANTAGSMLVTLASVGSITGTINSLNVENAGSRSIVVTVTATTITIEWIDDGLGTVTLTQP